MCGANRVPLAVLVGLGTLLAASPARAVDVFEIQTYEGDINAAGQLGLEVHSNFTAVGRQIAEFPGESVPDGTLRLTLEPSLGVLPWWELGAYFQVATAPSRSRADFGGFKLRSKVVAPAAATGPTILGLNVELGRGTAALGSDAWETEVRPIIARRFGRWFAAVNPILGWALDGPDRSAAPELEPCAKVRFDTHRGVALGVEYYAGLGRVTALLPAARQQHVIYLVGDLVDGPIDLNLGVGRGLTAATDDWTLKAILGTAF